MNIVRFAEAIPYSAPGHHDMSMVRLQGHEAGPSHHLWLGISVVESGGGTTLSSSPEEKMYVVLDGELHISNGQTEILLARWDSCRVAAGEERRLLNRSNASATVLLAMPLPRKD